MLLERVAVLRTTNKLKRPATTNVRPSCNSNWKPVAVQDILTHIDIDMHPCFHASSSCRLNRNFSVLKIRDEGRPLVNGPTGWRALIHSRHHNHHQTPSVTFQHHFQMGGGGRTGDLDLSARPFPPLLPELCSLLPCSLAGLPGLRPRLPMATGGGVRL